MIKLLLIFLISLNFNISAQELRARFVDYDSEKEYAPGDIFSSKVIIWSTQDSPESFKKLEGKVNKLIHLAEIRNLSRSENNFEAIVLEGRFIFKNQFPKSNISYSEHSGLSITWELPEISVIQSPVVSDMNFEMLSQHIYEKLNIYVQSLFAFVLFILISFYIRKYIKKRNERTRENKRKQDWINFFKNAKTRKEYEKIVNCETEWRSLVPQSPPLVEFKTLVNEIQYKKNWSEEEIKRVNENINQVKEVL